MQPLINKRRIVSLIDHKARKVSKHENKRRYGYLKLINLNPSNNKPMNGKVFVVTLRKATA